ncbi:MAG: SH3 domain-containing protein [Brevinematales bacterium]|nr:SH3 domain-containing protein [Brevinematales bacterium]
MRFIVSALIFIITPFLLYAELTPVSKDGKWGYADEKGVTVIPFQFKFAHSFSDGVAVVCTNYPGKELWGVIDPKGDYVFLPQFSRVDDFTDDISVFRAIVKSPDGKPMTELGILTKDGKKIVIPYASWAGIFNEGLLSVFQGEKGWTYYNKKGKPAFPGGYKGVSSFKNGLAIVIKNSKYLMIDKKGKTVKKIDPLKSPYPKQSLNPPIYYKSGESIKAFALSGLLMRDGPGTNFQKLVKIPFGAKVKILENPDTSVKFISEGIEGYWVRVEYLQTNGYVFDGYLSTLPIVKKDEGYSKMIGKVKERWEINVFPDGGEGTEMIYLSIGKNKGVMEVKAGWEWGTEYIYLYGIRPTELFLLFRYWGLIKPDAVYRIEQMEIYYASSDSQNKIRVTLNMDGTVIIKNNYGY